MKRRVFLKYFCSISTWSLIQSKGCFSTQDTNITACKYLTLNDTWIQIQNEKLILLPENPPPNHCIFFQFSNAISDSQVPRIVSRMQTIVHQTEPLILDQPSSFKMIYDSQKNDWYINKAS